jgi:MFS family permease
MSPELKRKLGMAAKIGVLCIIMFQYAKSFSTPAMSSIQAVFQPLGLDRATIQQIESLPSLLAIPGAFSVAILERFMKKKTILWIAMLLSLVGGVMAGFMPETVEGFYGIMVGRVLLGLGRGMIFPMASSFIADLFTGKERDQLMSFKTASGGLSGVVFQMIGGALAVFSWRYSFIAYLFIIPIILMVVFSVPEPDVKPAPVKSGNKQMGAAVWILIALAFLWNIFQFSVFTSMSMVVSGSLENGGLAMGSTVESASVLSTLTFATAAGAICYGAFIKGRLGGFDIPISMAIMGAGFFLYTHFYSLELYFVWTAIFGFGFGMFNPALILQAVKLVPREGATMALSILAALQNLGQSLSPTILAFLAPIFGAGAIAPALANWDISWICCLIMAAGVFVLMFVVKGRAPELVAGTAAERKPKEVAAASEPSETDEK